MLDGLKNLNYPGRKEDLIYFLQVVIGLRALKSEDARILCNHAPACYQLRLDDLLSYCAAFGWIAQKDLITIEKEISGLLKDSIALNRYMIKSSLKKLFEENIFDSRMFSYDVEKSRVSFCNEILPLAYAPIRNVLISQGFFIAEKSDRLIFFWVNPDFENELAIFCKKSFRRFTLAQLKARLEANSIAGENAEAYVLQYEKRRITNPTLKKKIKRISEVDVGAGYDILSFESNSSSSYDRFIEVKAISKRIEFFWSKNESEIAKLLGEKYYLYLVELSKINDSNYVPIIIANPAVSVMQSTDWFLEPESYHVQKVVF